MTWMGSIISMIIFNPYKEKAPGGGELDSTRKAGTKSGMPAR